MSYQDKERDTRFRWRRAVVFCATVIGLLAGLACFFALRWNPAPPSHVPERAGATSTDMTAVPAEVQLMPHARAFPETQRELQQLLAKEDPANDVWDTEQLSDLANAQLSKLTVTMQGPGRIQPDDVALLAAESFVGRVPRAESIVEVYRSGPIVVRRAAAGSTAAAESTGDLATTLNDLTSTMDPNVAPRIALKLFRIDRGEHSFSTLIRYESFQLTEQGSRQQTAICDCEWSQPTTTAPKPRLKRFEVREYEETEVSTPTGTLLVDCTEAALRGNESYMKQFVPGIGFWLTRIPKEFMGHLGHHGMSVGDVNGDDLDDLYVCDAGGLPNRLLIQQSDGSLLDVSHESGVDILEDSVGSLLVDLDNDGDQDLVVATDPILQTAENDGTGRFTVNARIHVNTDSFSISAADYDADGDLDLYVCGYKVRKREPTDRSLPFPLPYHDANNGGRNVLLRNDGNFHFSDATADAGLDVGNTRFSMAAAWEDFDNDGDLDLYVANDFGRNNLYRNDGGRFAEIAAAAGVEDHASGMSVSWADYDRDGRMDVYVGNMFSAAGNRVTYQRRFAEGIPERTVSYLQRMARGNTLFANQSQTGRSGFRDVSESMGVMMGRWAWGSRWVDLTNDGWPDLVVANGYVTSDNPNDL